MTYRLCPQTGDSIAVPQLVFTNLTRATGDHMRVALYILATHSTDPKDIAHALGLKSLQAAQKALDFWHGVGLLEAERPTSRENQPTQPAKQPPITAEQLRTAFMRDPMVSTLATEAQAYLGQSLGQKDIQRLVSLYVNESIPVDVILLCAAHIASQGRHSVTQLERELDRWPLEGVTNGQEAEAYLQRLHQREKQQAAVAALLGIPYEALTMADKRCICRWFEEYGYNQSMVEEAILHGNGSKDAKYINGILKSWYAKGWRTPADTRGNGSLEGSNARVDRPAPSGNDILQRATRRPLRLKRED